MCLKGSVTEYRLPAWDLYDRFQDGQGETLCLLTQLWGRCHISRDRVTWAICSCNSIFPANEMLADPESGLGTLTGHGDYHEGNLFSLGGCGGLRGGQPSWPGPMCTPGSSSKGSGAWAPVPTRGTQMELLAPSHCSRLGSDQQRDHLCFSFCLSVLVFPKQDCTHVARLSSHHWFRGHTSAC